MKARPGAMLVAALLVTGTVGLAVRSREDTFDHRQHAEVFPLCQTCHVGAVEEGAPIWPALGTCAECHDGTIEDRVDWQPPSAPHPTNLRFTHPEHAEEFRRKHADSTLDCTSCHAAEGAAWMEVQRAVTGQCLECHGVTAAHVAAPDTACATCHVTLAQSSLVRETVAGLEAPPSHDQPGFAMEGHGGLAQPVVKGRRTFEVAPSCATCHTRDFCLECHVNAPEVPVIQALATDPRGLAMTAELEPPASHEAPGFLTTHGRSARTSPETCATCHTRESCLACHAGRSSVVLAMHPAGPGRAIGAQITRRRPPSHGADFSETHGPVAAAAPNTCATCHARTECLDCHQPVAAATQGYHPPAFLSRHPAAAWARESDCSTCHNPSAFCASCHAQAGLVATGPLTAGFHDGQQAFLVGHGQAARQSLETCASCHAERDCLTCHSAQGGRRFNPHGPGFDPERLLKKNPEMCTACHGQAIPRR